MKLRARQFEYMFPRPALVMGIVNVTPDSFSDGGQFLDPAAAVAQALKLIDEGADLIDIGGESTRPDAVPVSATEELRRVLPVIERLAALVKVPLSIDTQKPAVARAALQAGASLVNDIAANRREAEMWRVVAEAQAGYVLMHMQGTPQTMQRAPTYQDVASEVDFFFTERLRRVEASGISADQVILDVGLGFGKTAEHNLQLLAGLNGFTKWQRPLLVGLSRKSFLCRLPGAEVTTGRLPAALAATSLAVAGGARIIRTHDVAATVQAVRLVESVMAHKY